MLAKILLTLSLLLGLYLVVRARLRVAKVAGTRPLPARPPLLSQPRLQLLAYGLVVSMGAGSLVWLYLAWEEDQEILRVQVINTHNGAVVTYEARRAAIEAEGRRFKTLDGREVILAEVERLVLE